MVACQNGHVDIARLLIEKDADVGQANNNGRTPLTTWRARTATPTSPRSC